VTTFDYDIRGRLTKKTYPAYGPENDPQIDFEQYQYDAAGRLTKKTTPNLDDIEYTYNYEGQGASRSYFYNAQEVNWTFEYNTDRSRKKVTRNWQGVHEWNYTYDPYSGRLASVTDPFDRAIAYEYDKNGNRTALTTPQGRQEFTFDALNRLISAKDRLGNETTYEYECCNRLKHVTYPNNVVTTYTYDAVNRLTSIEHKEGSILYSSFNYTLSPAGLRTRVDEVLHPAGNPQETNPILSTVEYQYDDLGRLTGETRTGSEYEEYQLRYFYDAVGNRRILERGGVNTYYEYNERDFLLSESPLDNDPNPPISYMRNPAKSITRSG
jgi:YD repeat-containing protein